MSTYSLDFDHVDSSSTREISASQRHLSTHGLNKPKKMKEDKKKGSKSRSALRASGTGKKKNTSGGTKRPGQSSNISTGTGNLACLKLNLEEIDRLQNLVDEYKKEIAKLKEENKTLKNVQYRNEKALRELDKEHNEFPQILESMSEEMRVLKTQNKKYVEKLNITEKQLRHLHEELMHHKDKLEKRSQSMKSRNSEHHSKLIARIRDLEESIKERDERISYLTKQQTYAQKDSDRDQKDAKEKYARLVALNLEVQAKYDEALIKIKNYEKLIARESIYSKHLSTYISSAPSSRPHSRLSNSAVSPSSSPVKSSARSRKSTNDDKSNNGLIPHKTNHLPIIESEKEGIADDLKVVNESSKGDLEDKEKSKKHDQNQLTKSIGSNISTAIPGSLPTLPSRSEQDSGETQKQENVPLMTSVKSVFKPSFTPVAVLFDNQSSKASELSIITPTTAEKLTQNQREVVPAQRSPFKPSFASSFKATSTDVPIQDTAPTLRPKQTHELSPLPQSSIFRPTFLSSSPKTSNSPSAINASTEESSSGQSKKIEFPTSSSNTSSHAPMKDSVTLLASTGSSSLTYKAASSDFSSSDLSSPHNASKIPADRDKSVIPLPLAEPAFSQATIKTDNEIDSKEKNKPKLVNLSDAEISDDDQESEKKHQLALEKSIKPKKKAINLSDEEGEEQDNAGYVPSKPKLKSGMNNPRTQAPVVTVEFSDHEDILEEELI